MANGSPKHSGLLRKRRSSASVSSSQHKKTTTKITPRDIPRLVPRDLPFNQSYHVAVRNKERILTLMFLDWFHVFLRFPVWMTLPILLAFWTAIILLFAAIYVRLHTLNKNLDCGLGPPGTPMAWATAFAFSLETCTTVGCKWWNSGAMACSFQGYCGTHSFDTCLRL